MHALFRKGGFKTRPYILMYDNSGENFFGDAIQEVPSKIEGPPHSSPRLAASEELVGV